MGSRSYGCPQNAISEPKFGDFAFGVIDDAEMLEIDPKNLPAELS